MRRNTKASAVTNLVEDAIETGCVRVAARLLLDTMAFRSPEAWREALSGAVADNSVSQIKTRVERMTADYEAMIKD